MAKEEELVKVREKQLAAENTPAHSRRAAPLPWPWPGASASSLRGSGLQLSPNTPSSLRGYHQK